MLRTLFLLGGRVRRSPVLRTGTKAGAKDPKAAARAARHQSERAAEKQFLRLVFTAQARRQRQISDAIKRAAKTKFDEAAVPKSDARYVRNRKIAQAELAAVQKEVAQSESVARKVNAVPPPREKPAKRAMERLSREAVVSCDKKQKAREERFAASLQRRLERRKARVDALVAKAVKAEATAKAKEEALAKAEMSAKADQQSEETIRQRQEQRAARVKGLVESRTKASTAEAEVGSLSVGKQLTGELHPAMEDQDARIEAIIAEILNVEKASDNDENAETLAAERTAAASTSRRSGRKAKTTAVVLLETPAVATSTAEVPQESMPVEAEAAEASLEEATTPQMQGRPVSAQPQATTDVSTAAPVEAVEEAVSTMSEVQELRVDAELPPSPPMPLSSATAEPKELASAHEDFVAHLEKAKERTTAPLLTRIPPAPSAPASSPTPPRTWMVAENSTGLFRL
ncbi:hypothetical protein NXY56_006377 [Leishmania guyanensis]